MQKDKELECQKREREQDLDYHRDVVNDLVIDHRCECVCVCVCVFGVCSCVGTCVCALHSVA